MHRQEIFDSVKQHLLQQNKRSIAVSGIDGTQFCRYRGDGGLSCAIGNLIPHDLYTPAMEDKGVEKLMATYPALKALLSVKDSYDADFLSALQHIHDSVLPQNWELELSYLAIREGLNYE